MVDTRSLLKGMQVLIYLQASVKPCWKTLQPVPAGESTSLEVDIRCAKKVTNGLSPVPNRFCCRKCSDTALTRYRLRFESCPASLLQLHRFVHETPLGKHFLICRNGGMVRTFLCTYSFSGGGSIWGTLSGLSNDQHKTVIKGLDWNFLTWISLLTSCAI